MAVRARAPLVAFSPPSTALTETGWYAIDDIAEEHICTGSLDCSWGRPARPFDVFRFDRASGVLDPDYHDSMQQLVARGLNFEPMVTAVPDNEEWGQMRRLDVEVSETMDMQQLLQRVVEERPGGGVTAPSTSSCSSSASCPALWQRVASVSDVPSLLGAPVLGADGGMLGFLRLRTREPLTRPHWTAPCEQQQPPLQDDEAAVEIEGLECELSLLPLSAILASIVPAIAAVDPEQAMLLYHHLFHIAQRVEARRQREQVMQLLPTSVRRLQGGYVLFDEVSLIRYIRAVTHVVRREVIPGMPRLAVAALPPLVPIVLSTAAAVLVQATDSFAETCTEYKLGFARMQKEKLRVEEGRYATQRPFVLDTTHHAHVLELTAEFECGPDEFVCAVCSRRSEDQQHYVCARCGYHVHIACISRDGVQLLSSAQRQKRKRVEVATHACSEQGRGPFTVVVFDSELGKYGMETYSTADEMRQACEHELEELGCGSQQADNDNSGDEEGAEADVATLDELVMCVFAVTRDAGQQRINWVEVVEAGKRMRSE